MNRRDLFSAAGGAAAAGLAGASKSASINEAARIPHPPPRIPTPPDNGPSSLSPLQQLARDAADKAEAEENAAYFQLDQLRSVSQAAKRAYQHGRRLRRCNLWHDYQRLMGYL